MKKGTKTIITLGIGVAIISFICYVIDLPLDVEIIVMYLLIIVGGITVAYLFALGFINLFIKEDRKNL